MDKFQNPQAWGDRLLSGDVAAPVHYRDIPSLPVVSVCFGILAETAVDSAIVFRLETNSE
jgi:hypothetical protein